MWIYEYVCMYCEKVLLLVNKILYISAQIREENIWWFLYYTHTLNVHDFSIFLCEGVYFYILVSERKGMGVCMCVYESFNSLSLCFFFLCSIIFLCRSFCNDDLGCGKWLVDSWTDIQENKITCKRKERNLKMIMCVLSWEGLFCSFGCCCCHQLLLNDIIAKDD